MSCENPNVAVVLGIDDEGTKHLKFFGSRNKGSIHWNLHQLIERYGSENVVLLDCGHCPSCLKKRRKEWSLRCLLESKVHEKNSFVTLTYDDEHYSCLNLKADIDDFKKCLWNRGIKYRYYGCSEKGDIGNRWHHHIILFGYEPDDLKFYSKTKSGGYQYTSKFLDKVWHRGFVTVSEFEPALGAYVAGYVAKKLEDPDDESYQFMSTRPGIGYEWFVQNLDHIYDTDFIITNFGNHKSSIPRYLDKIAEKLGFDLTEIRKKRSEKSLNNLSMKAKDAGLEFLDQAVGYEKLSMKDKHNVLRKRGF